MAITKEQKHEKSDRSTVPPRFCISCLLVCSFIAYLVGRISRYYIALNVFVLKDTSNKKQNGRDDNLLPTPKAHSGKIVPQTIYSTKNFDTRRSTLTSSHWLQPADDDVDNSPNESPTNNFVSDPLNEKLMFDKNGNAHYVKEEEEHLPAGQHLLIDIDGLDASFLNSEARLATAMISMVDYSGLTLLSYHCHGLYPEGVSCAGVLLESHVAFHTWPSEGVITLDLFTCGSTSLLDTMPLVEKLFVIPCHDNTNPTVSWAYKRRGFNVQTSLIGERDTFAYPLGILGMEYKKEIASLETSTGKIARVYEMQENTSTFASRQFYLDGVFKSSSVGQAAAHESFVHPPMLAHESPKRVVVFGAALGASAREVLKHSGVQSVTVVGADKDMEDFARKYLPEWNGLCEKNSSFDDSRVNFVYGQTPMEWIAKYNGVPYDIVFLDLFGMEEEFAIEIMSNHKAFFKKMYDIISFNGVISINVPGYTRSVESMNKGYLTSTRKYLRDFYAQELTSLDFVKTYEYEEYKMGFPETRSYVVAFKDIETSENWNTNEAKTKIKLRNRIRHMPLSFFDAATMASYSKSSAPSAKNLKDIHLHARTTEVVAKSKNSQILAFTNENEVNSSCSNLENSEVCRNTQINLPIKMN